MDESESWVLWGQTATRPRHQAISHAAQSLAVCRLPLRQEDSASRPGSQPCLCFLRAVASTEEKVTGDVRQPKACYFASQRTFFTFAKILGTITESVLGLASLTNTSYLKDQGHTNRPETSVVERTSNSSETIKAVVKTK